MSSVNVIAFYLPQYYPISENDKYYGKGFTEWTNVGKSTPLYRGHYQPRIPADLGYYDLRIPEVMEQQVLLAKEANIAAFCYYHYWFGNGKVLLEKPLQLMLNNRNIDFPFCLAWANHTWYKKTWEADAGILKNELIVEQAYLGEDDIIKHFYYLLSSFKDPRYYRIHNKLVFVIYDCISFPYIDKFKNIWEELAAKEGLPGFYFVGCANDIGTLKNEIKYSEYDAVILSLLTHPIRGGIYNFWGRVKYKLLMKVSSILGRPLQVYQYSDAIKKFVDKLYSENNIYPVLIPNWDASPRRGKGAYILHGSTPELFKQHVKSIINIVRNKPSEDQIVFLKSWNEWGEGNYMEPDLKYGKGYINSLREALEEIE